MEVRHLAVSFFIRWHRLSLEAYEMVWQNLGVNYKSLSKVGQDIAYFNSIGLHYVRIHVPYAPIPWSSSALANWRGVAKQFHDAGFHVMWGFSSLGLTTLTSSNWSSYASSVIAEADYCEDNNVCDMFIIGNELEQFNDDSTLTDAQLRANIRALATSVKAVTARPVIYCSEYGSSASSFGTYRWIQEGKGDLDYLGANLYGNYDPATQVYFPRYAVGQGGIPALNAAFCGGWILSEFGVEGSASNFNAMPRERKAIETARYLKFIKENGNPRSYLYQYRAYDDADSSDSFFLRSSNDDFIEAWNPLYSNNGRKFYSEV